MSLKWSLKLGLRPEFKTPAAIASRACYASSRRAILDCCSAVPSSERSDGCGVSVGSLSARRKRAERPAAVCGCLPASSQAMNRLKEAATMLSASVASPERLGFRFFSMFAPGLLIVVIADLLPTLSGLLCFAPRPCSAATVPWPHSLDLIDIARSAPHRTWQRLYILLYNDLGISPKDKYEVISACFQRTRVLTCVGYGGRNRKYETVPL